MEQLRPPRGANHRRLHRIVVRDGWGCHWCGIECFDLCFVVWREVTCLDGVFWMPVTKRAFGDVATLEHLVPRSAGGTNDPSNLVVACQRCNATRGAARPGFLPKLVVSA